MHIRIIHHKTDICQTFVCDFGKNLQNFLSYPQFRGTKREPNYDESPHAAMTKGAPQAGQRGRLFRGGLLFCYGFLGAVRFGMAVWVYQSDRLWFSQFQAWACLRRRAAPPHSSMTSSRLTATRFKSIGSVQRLIPLTDTRFSEIYSSSADAELYYNFRLHHSVHVTVQNGKFQCG